MSTENRGFPHVDNRSSYIPAIDGLRAIAVLSVLLFHARASLLPGGFSGVDVFFVISGYVISSTLAREKQPNFFSFATHFYARRIVRIYPALVVCLVLVGVATTMLVPPSWLSQAADLTAKRAFFGLSNFALVWYNDGYFSPRVEFNAFTHTWSLAVEEQFYLVFPIVFYIWLRYRDRKVFWGRVANWLLVALSIASLALSWFETSADPERAFYLLPSRFWELACGALLFMLHSRGKCVPRSVGAVELSVLMGLVLVACGAFFSDRKLFPFPWAGLSVAGASLVIAGVGHSVGKRSIVALILENRIMVYIGKISYSLYLWHWPVFVLSRWTVGMEKPMAILCAVALSVCLSVISFHFVERPIRQSIFVASRSRFFVVSRSLSE
jgi:peptidoglycan/LPS O-acetylase OafA/YrhL